MSALFAVVSGKALMSINRLLYVTPNESVIELRCIKLRVEKPS